MLQPKRTKFNKMHKGRNRGFTEFKNIGKGIYGLKAITRGRLTSNEIESARRAMTHAINRQGKIWVKIFPDKPITKKPLEVRMGKGKGNVEYWVSLIKPGKILYEMNGVSQELAKKAFKLASAKLSVKTIFINSELI
ncbi:MAG: 50S ribosomal protein L16 [Candidatus Makana argininalis]